jgi:hypothetical protein
MATTEKISVTIGRTELGYAKRLASRLGVSLSGFITDAVRQRVLDQQRREAALEVLASFSPHDRATPAEARELLERWAPLRPVTAKRNRSRTSRPKRSRKV